VDSGNLDYGSPSDNLEMLLGFSKWTSVLQSRQRRNEFRPGRLSRPQ
jgi:hypothetical protein